METLLRNPDAFAHDYEALQRALEGNTLRLPHVALRNFLVLHCGMSRTELLDMTLDGLKHLFEDARRVHTAGRAARGLMPTRCQTCGKPIAAGDAYCDSKCEALDIEHIAVDGPRIMSNQHTS